MANVHVTSHEGISVISEISRKSSCTQHMSGYVFWHRFWHVVVAVHCLADPIQDHPMVDEERMPGTFHANLEYVGASFCDVGVWSRF